MTQMKLDGVIEAVRYAPGGNIVYVLIFERHGIVWSDHILLEREELSERIKLGKRIVVGERKLYCGSVFQTGTAVTQINGDIMTEGQKGGRDLLIGVPVF
jgi:hypothetical protein